MRVISIRVIPIGRALSASDPNDMNTIRIANGQGFWGDSLQAPIEQVRRGPIDYLTLDYLAEITMSIMQKQRSRDPRAGYARDFVPMIEEVLPDLVERNIKVVANAGGVNPQACCEAVIEVARRKGYGGKVKVGIVAGDDIMSRLDGFIHRGGARFDSSASSKRQRLLRWPRYRGCSRQGRTDCNRRACHRHRSVARSYDSRIQVGCR